MPQQVLPLYLTGAFFFLFFRLLNSIIILTQSKANHNKDYSVVKTCKAVPKGIAFFWYFIRLKVSKLRIYKNSRLTPAEKKRYFMEGSENYSKMD